ncbi:MAG: hypothetical protein ACYCUT_10185, partial [bacterium]
MENNKKHDILRRFPSVQSILQDNAAVKLAESFPFEFIKEKIEDLIKSEKNKAIEFLKSKNDSEGLDSINFTVDFFIKRLTEDLDNFSYSLKRVVNGTGVVIHTNLG